MRIPPAPPQPTLDELLKAALDALDKGDPKTARSKLADIKKRIPDIPGESRDLWRHKIDLWKSMVDLAAFQPPASHVPELRDAMTKVPDRQSITKTIKTGEVPLICKELAVISKCGDKRPSRRVHGFARQCLGRLRPQEKEMSCPS